MQSRIEEHWFGESFQFQCQEGRGNAGCDSNKLETMLKAYKVIVPKDYLRWRPEDEQPLTDGQVFDLLEFSYEHVAFPIEESQHSYWGHSHYAYDVDLGRAGLKEDVNRIFVRNGMAFEMVDGEVVRLAPTVLAEELSSSVFHSGDQILDELLATARTKFLNHSPDVRREGLEKLWDAWERLKTIEPGSDKKAQAAALLDRAAAGDFRQLLEKEARTLTEIGNIFMIRHTETNKIPITESGQIDYLFARMFGLMYLLLKSTGRLR